MISVEREVYSSTAEGRISSILLDTGLSPATEGSEIWEGRVAIVMSVPKGHVFVGSARTSCAHNALPHVVVGVDTWYFSMASHGIYEVSDILAVGCTRALSPAAAWWGISLNIEPDHSIVSTAHARHEIIDLGWSTLASAREHIDINIGDTGSAGIVDIGETVGIESTVWVVSTGDSEGDSIVLPAGVSWNWLQGGIVNTLGGESRRDKGSKSDHWSHFIRIFIISNSVSC